MVSIESPLMVFLSDLHCV